jgi:ABC-type multidrug transport system ATPase subunit
VHDNISPNDFFDLQRRFYPAFDDAILLNLIEGLSLSDHVSKAMYMLSAGSKRKVWLAAAFASGAAVTLLDEPFAALDKPSINFLIERLVTFAHDSDRAWVIADYEVPQNLVTNLSIDLDL